MLIVLADSPGKPSDWTIRGVVCGPREVDPAIRGPEWVAWATGPDHGRVQGTGQSPEDALFSLTLELRRLGE